MRVFTMTKQEFQNKACLPKNNSGDPTGYWVMRIGSHKEDIPWGQVNDSWQDNHHPQKMRGADDEIPVDAIGIILEWKNYNRRRHTQFVIFAD